MVKHNGSKHPLYSKWQDMKNRCYNTKVDRYNCYGGSGIKVCDEWKHSFANFYNWSILNGWKKGLTIERKNVDMDYCPDNCKYITPLEQHFNKKNTFFVEINGIKIALIELLYKNNLNHKYSTIWHGIKKGKAFEFYIKKYNIEYNKGKITIKN